MRLIDADGGYAIKASDNTGYKIECKNGMASVSDECGQGICEFILDDIPTAYDVDKVVGQLEQKAEESRKYWSKHDDECAFGEMNAYRNSVKIIKSGGVKSGE